MLSEPNSTTHAVLWRNVPCQDSTCGAAATSAGRRTYDVAREGVSALEAVGDAELAAFFDIDDDGMLDILVSTRTQRLVAILNNFDRDAYFLKVVGLNGVCPYEWCNERHGRSFRAYSVNNHGATFKYRITDNHGESHTRAVPQMPQSAHRPLELPYSLLGLSRLTTMVEELAIGLTINQPVHFQRFVGIIPNSALVVVPWPVDKPEEWDLLLYVTPSSRVLWVVGSLFIAMAVLCLVVIVLHWRENRADRREKIQNAHLFSFDAL